jgi:hypothetical protein
VHFFNGGKWAKGRTIGLHERKHSLVTEMPICRDESAHGGAMGKGASRN